MDIANMPAGRDMDAIVAEKVMGWKPESATPKSPDIIEWYEYRDDGTRYNVSHEARFFNPSTDIAAAMEIPPRMLELGKDMEFCYHMNCQLVVDKIFKAPGHGVWNFFYGPVAVPMLICRAALLAVKGE